MLRTTDSPRIWRLESADAMHVPSLRARSSRLLIISSGNLVANLIEKSSISVLYRLSDLYLSGYLVAESLERSKSVRAAPMSPAKLENYQANLAP
ncbi:hypothetical protein HZ326_0131 [Fusarium oxysporum f. sp. albedinis]|nr:hypothetical protein HZ326_0131 [Fusarium oxysporum f. sp. albedinis]